MAGVLGVCGEGRGYREVCFDLRGSWASAEKVASNAKPVDLSAQFSGIR